MKTEINNPNKIIFRKKGEKYSPEKENLREKLNTFFTIIQDAHYSYEIWWVLIGDEGRKEYFQTFLHFKEFFEPVAYANLASMMIALYKLYEDRGGTLNFKKLFAEAHQLKLIDNNSKKNFQMFLLKKFLKMQ